MKLISPLLVACATALACSPAEHLETSALELVDAGSTEPAVDAGAPCEPVPFSGASTHAAGYFTPSFDAPFSGVTVSRPSGAGFDFLRVELWYFGLNAAPTFPWPVMLWATSRAQCDTCVVFRRGCDAAGDGCGAAYLANGGSVRFDEASRDVDAGRIAGVAPVVRLVRWDFATDRQVDGAACLELTDVAFDARW